MELRRSCAPLSITHRRKRRLNPAVTEFIKILCQPNDSTANGEHRTGSQAPSDQIRLLDRTLPVRAKETDTPRIGAR